MKHMKKMMALLIAIVMVLSMSMSVYAAGEGQGEGGGEGGETPVVEVKNEITGADYDTAYFTASADEVDLIGHKFNAVQLLKAEEYDSDTKEYSGLSWGAQIEDNGVALLGALQANDTIKADFEKFVTVATDVTNDTPLFTAASFAKVVKTYDAAKLKALIAAVKTLQLTGQEINITEGMEAQALNGGIGYYMIDDITEGINTKDDVANVTVMFAAPGSNIVRIKVDKPSQDKSVQENNQYTANDGWNEVSDYNIGDAVPYKIESTIPDATNFDNYTMKFTDEMSNGLTLYDKWAETATNITPDNVTPANLKIMVGETDITSLSGTTVVKSDHGFTVEFATKTNGAAPTWAVAGADIVITFYGVLNQAADCGLDGETNKSRLEFSNNPDDSTSKGKTPDDTVITFTYELDVNKIDGQTEEILPGAQFALKATEGQHANQYAVVNASGIIVDWTPNKPAADSAADASGNTALLVSGQDGKFIVKGLDDGIYTLTEIKAPEGYNAIADITLEIKATTTNGSDYTDELEDTPGSALTALSLDVTANGKKTTKEGVLNTGIMETTVENNSGATLPETGGIGTTIFYILGAVLVIGAGVVLVTRRRMSAN